MLTPMGQYQVCVPMGEPLLFLQQPAVKLTKLLKMISSIYCSKVKDLVQLKDSNFPIRTSTAHNKP